MLDTRFNSLVFNRGIDSITHARPQAMPTLPERGEALPPDMRTRAQLDSLLKQNSMNDRLYTALRPQLANPELLAPGKFTAALGAVQLLLRQSAQERAGDADAARLLNRAGRLLGKEASLRELAQKYRSALYQG